MYSNGTREEVGASAAGHWRAGISVPRGFVRRALTLVLICFGGILPKVEAEPPFPEINPPLTQTSHLQRALALANAVDTNGPPVRVLIYGQSILEFCWMPLDAFLLSRYPGCSWQIENRTISGHTAPYMLKTAEADVYPYQPDLLVFHDYGDARAYAEFVQRVRSRTCADILLVGDHMASWDDPNEDTNNIPVETVAGTTWFDYVEQPLIALTNGACRADIRTPWKQYLLANGMSVTNLLADTVHLNVPGCDLMTYLLSAYLLAPVLEPPADPFDCDRVKRIALGTNAFEGTNQTTLPFTGSRIMLRTKGTAQAQADFMIDGLKPSAFITTYVHGRCSLWPFGGTPAILKIEAQTIPVAENWTLTVDSMKGVNGPMTFHVRGSVTGEDGGGRSDTDFTSKSGRVVILSEDWYWQTYPGGLTSGMQLTWSTAFNGADSAVSGAASAGASGWVEVIQGLTDGPHLLTVVLRTGTPDQFPEILAYHPGGSELGGDNGGQNLLRYARRGADILLCWPQQMGSLLRSSVDLIHWVDATAVSPLFGRCQTQLSVEAASTFFRPSK